MVSDLASLRQAIAEQTAAIKTLKDENAQGSLQDAAKAKLGELKKQLALAANAASGSGLKEQKKPRERLLLKTPKVPHSTALAPQLLTPYGTGHARLRTR